MNTKVRNFRKLAKKAINRVSSAVGMMMARYQPPPKDLHEHIARLDPRFGSRLISMFLGEPQVGADGQPHPIDRCTRIPPSQGMWIYDLCVSVKPQSTLEIGMAYGYSTIFFLAAMEHNGAGHHTSIDPFQRSHWRGIGLNHANSIINMEGSKSHFSFIEDRSDRVAIDFVRSNSSFDIIFIDGNHRFDDVLVDFYLYAPLCKIGGHIVFDDMWMSSIQTVADFVRTNREDFVEIQTKESNISVFKRVGDDDRKWSHFRNFTVSESTN